MFDDIRDHDAQPSEQERDWMENNPFALIARLAVLAIIAIAIGASTTVLVEPRQKPAATAAATGD
jgi:hypothetical protein